MNILMVAAELAPHAKTGGLADAIAGLARALRARGHDVRVLMPHYHHLQSLPAKTLTISHTEPRYRIHEFRGDDGIGPIYFLDVAELDGVRTVYTGDDRDAVRFASLADAAAAFAAHAEWHPYVVHCHDWHAALVPIALRCRSLALPTLLTLHNIGYQGVFAGQVLMESGFSKLAAELPPESTGAGTVNFLRAGIASAEKLSTVSPTYAREIQSPEFGMGLEDLIVRRRDALTGILNGVDYGTWDPRNDPFLPNHYGSPAAPEKLAIKAELASSLGLRADAATPVIGVVSRLAEQKGIDLVVEALPSLLERTTACFAVLGTGDPALEEALRALADGHAERLSFTAAHSEELAHKIIAGSDIFAVPSRYEPCGLTQLYSLRYGTVPVVRRTGGLADTVQHFDPNTATGNGAVFDEADSASFCRALETAIRWYGLPDVWSVLEKNGMEADHSWARRAPEYEVVYSRLVRN
jgi:starch synthase